MRVAKAAKWLREPLRGPMFRAVNPDLMKQVADLAAAVRKTARGDDDADEIATIVAKHRRCLDMLRVGVAAEAAKDPEREAAIRVLDAVQVTVDGLSISAAVPVAVSHLKDLVALLQAAPSAREPIPALRSMLFAASDALDARARRLEFLTPFVDSLCRASQNKWFTIHDEIAWLMVLDMRDHLVIDLADWAKTSHVPGGGGFLRASQAHHRAAFPQCRAWGRTTDDYVSRFQDEGYSAARLRVFPDAGANVSMADFDALARAFRKRFEPLTRDRHANRAHPYEHEMSQNGVVRMLNLEEITDVVEYASQLLNDLLLVAEGVSRSKQSGFFHRPTDSVQSMLDIVLLSAHTRSLLATRGIATEDFLKDLHAHDQSAHVDGSPAYEGQRRVTFNDWAAERRGLERFGLVRPIAAEQRDAV